ncbi:MAG: hypothetical protein KAS87_04305 [Candidatus Omnitrophica bacterium]|nr:hypothetical protein [Candidatus Omnitrophota bacterium]
MMTLWYIPVVLRILLINTIFPWLLKGKVVQANFVQRFFLQYLFCSVFAVLVAISLGQLVFTATTLIIAVIGVFNGFGAYSQWRATQINLSAMSIFAFLDDAIAISLGYLILKEGKFLNTGVGIGLTLCASVVILFAVNNYLKRKKGVKGKEHLPLRFFGYVMSFTIIWGVATFLTRYFALEGVGVGTFIFGWYGGSVITAFIIFLIKKEKGIFQEVKETMTNNNFCIMFVMSVLIMTNIWLSYWALQLAPLMVVKPIFFVSAMVIPAIIGLYIFKEAKKYERREKLFFVIAFVGGVLIALSFTP